MEQRASAQVLTVTRFLYLGMVGLPAPISSELMYAV
jgi:hypothetical protein